MDKWGRGCDLSYLVLKLLGSREKPRDLVYRASGAAGSLMTRRAREGKAVRKRREIAQNAQKCTHKKEPVRIARTPSELREIIKKVQQNAT